MPFAYYQKLSPRQRRIYRESDRIETVDLKRPYLFFDAVTRLERALASGNRAATKRAAQALLDNLTEGMGVTPLIVEVRDRRPSWDSGELLGLYETGRGPGQKISVWMRTAQRAQLVKFRTFLRTLLHELCHHLDYERFGLEDSFHTEGFFKRESSLLRQLQPASVSQTRRPTTDS